MLYSINYGNKNFVTALLHIYLLFGHHWILAEGGGELWERNLYMIRSRVLSYKLSSVILIVFVYTIIIM